MDMSQIYWLVKLDDIRGLINGIGFFIITAGVISTIITITTYVTDKEFDTNSKVNKFGFVLSSLLIILSLTMFSIESFMPSTKQMAAIIVVPKICTAIEGNEQLKKLPTEIVALASSWIEELRPENIKTRPDSSKKAVAKK